MVGGGGGEKLGLELGFWKERGGDGEEIAEQDLRGENGPGQFRGKEESQTVGRRQDN